MQLACSQGPVTRAAKPEPMSGRLGVFGGTFDPIHLGHLAIAECARVELGLSSVLFMPALIQPHKMGQPVSGAEHRWAMVQLAIADNPNFAACNLELDRDGPSYTSESIAHIRAQTPLDQEIVFICGADSLLDMATWYRPADLLSTARVAVARRPGRCQTELDVAIQRLERDFAAKIELFEAPLMDVSSSLIRERASLGKSIRYLVAEQVYTYISKHSLYQKGNLTSL